MSLQTPVQKDDHIQGKADAAVTLVEYGDYQCPYCGRAFAVVKQLQKEFGDQLRFVFRNMPLNNLHPMAELAAESAESAALQNRFWEMHDLLYENQQNLGPELIEAAAHKLGLDLDGFNKAVNSRQSLPRVKRDIESAMASGVNGTPSFFVNGQPVQDWSYEGLSKAIKAAL